MKNLIILVFALIMAAFNSCKKDPLAETIVGTWEVREAAGGLMSQPVYSPGNGNIIKFTGDAYEKFVNGKLIKRGKYSIIKEKSWATDDRIIYDNDTTSMKTFVEVHGKYLTLYIGAPIAADGLMIRYVRQ